MFQISLKGFYQNMAKLFACPSVFTHEVDMSLEPQHIVPSK
jgi:hypothetical protein